MVEDGCTLQMSSSDRVPKINPVASATFRTESLANSAATGTDALSAAAVVLFCDIFSDANRRKVISNPFLDLN